VLRAGAYFESNHPALSKIDFGIVERGNEDVDEMILVHGGLSDYLGFPRTAQALANMRDTAKGSSK
jgi:hypothetical protein